MHYEPLRLASSRDARRKVTEGIASPVDLKDFDDEALKIVKENLQCPAGRVADPNPNANGATIPTPAFMLGARSQTRLAATAKCIQFYDMIDRPIDHLNIYWMPVVKNFDIQWKALVDCKKSDEPDIPKISRTLSVLKWMEAFSDYLLLKSKSDQVRQTDCRTEI